MAQGGAKAIATSSGAVASARGYTDGEALPFDEALGGAAQIVAAVDLPVSVDFESGYSSDPEGAPANVAPLLEQGVVGLNPVPEQAACIAAVRRAIDASGVPAFFNARIDVFLKNRETEPKGPMPDASARVAAYAKPERTASSCRSSRTRR